MVYGTESTESSTQPKIFWPDTVPLPKSSVTGVFSELNQYRSSIRTVSDQYAHICIRPVRTACLRAVFAELIQSCRTDTDPIYSSVSDPLPKSYVAFLGTDLDQIGSSSDSKRTILLCTSRCTGSNFVCRRAAIRLVAARGNLARTSSFVRNIYLVTTLVICARMICRHCLLRPQFVDY